MTFNDTSQVSQLSGSQSVIQEVVLVSTHLPWGPARVGGR